MKDQQLQKRIVIVGHQLRFPNGHGAAARIANYASGLVSIGAPVTVLCLKPYEPAAGPMLNAHARGTYSGAEFCYTCGTSIVATKRWRRWLQNILGCIGALNEIVRIRRNNGISTLLYYGVGHSLSYTLFGWLLCRLAGVPFVVESTEEPYVYAGKSVWVRMKKYIFWRFATKTFDAVIVISRSLEREFRLSVRANVVVELIPVVVDTSRFLVGTHNAKNIITYCGSLHNFGEVDLLLDIWPEIWKDFPGYTLRLIGNAPMPYLDKLMIKARKLGIDDSIDFCGDIERDRLPVLLTESRVLVLPRPANVATASGFPNKLGEYLATGRPVLCTAVGDITNYLEDSKNAYIVPPGEMGLFIERLRFILNHPVEAMQVGSSGRRVAETCFDLAVHCHRLIELFEKAKAVKKFARYP